MGQGFTSGVLLVFWVVMRRQRQRRHSDDSLPPMPIATFSMPELADLMKLRERLHEQAAAGDEDPSLSHVKP